MACSLALLPPATGADSDYKNPGLPVEQRVASLVSQMTLEEKIDQITQGLAGANNNANNENPDVAQFNPALGSVIFGNDNVIERNALQRKAMSESRLGIPVIFGHDVIHGYRTIFPVPLAQACSWNPALVEESCEIAAREAKSAGIDWTFSPMVDVARDPRWGRVVEGYGEDPYATAVFAVAAVRGYQGRQAPYRIAACLKHYVGYAASEGGRDYAYSDVSYQTLWETYLPPYLAGINAGALTLMSGFNDIAGVPASANPYTLTDILRGQWGFTGFVVSDWASVVQLVRQGHAENNKDAARLALNAGVDMDMVDGAYRNHMSELVSEGKVTMKTIDEAVSRILRVKFETGLFDDPYVKELPREERYLLPSYRAAARHMAVESMVLLKNDNNVLPLSGDRKTIALIGPMVKNKRALMGSWAAMGRAEDVVDLEEGFQTRFGKSHTILYARGCDIDKESGQDLHEALETGRKADIIFLCVGESEGMNGENASRSTISLTPAQERLINEVTALGKPVVLLVAAGRPIALHHIEPRVQALLVTWLPGSEAGHAVADLVSGDQNPSGRLAITFPRTEGQIPTYYNMRDRARASGRYQDIPTEPLYSFGDGLSYCPFEYANLKTGSTQWSQTGTIKVTVDVSNKGSVAGRETVFLYIRDVAASISQPQKRLIAFDKIDLAAGETKTVSFDIVPDRDLFFYGPKGQRILEPGVFRIMVKQLKQDITLK